MPGYEAGNFRGFVFLQFLIILEIADVLHNGVTQTENAINQWRLQSQFFNSRLLSKMFENRQKRLSFVWVLEDNIAFENQ